MPPRPKKPSEKLKASSRLLEALSFLSCITKDEGTPYETHILLQNKTAVAYNDFLAAGCLIDEEIWCAPYNKTLINALSKCGEGYTLTIDGTKIVLKSGKFKANIPCIDPTILSFRFPDKPCAQIDDSFKDALKCMDIIKPELNAQKVHLLSFLLNGQSVISTDGKLLIEYWHGLNLPTLAIPKSIIAPILKNPKKLIQLGFSSNSVTFYFEDWSWIKSQLYVDEWPLDIIQKVLDRNSNPLSIPNDFYKALNSVSAFSEEGKVYFDTDLLCSHNTIEKGATYEVKGLLKGPVFSAKYLLMVQNYVEKIDFFVPANGHIVQYSGKGYIAYFFGNKVRGVIPGYG